MRTTLGIAAGLVLVALAGCSSTGVVASGSSPAPTVDLPAACSSSQLNTAIAGYSEGDTANGTITYTLKSGQTCTLVGYPQLQLSTSAGDDSAAEMSSSVSGVSPTVILKEGTEATATFSWAATPPAAGTCPTLTGLTVTTPGEDEAQPVTVPSGLAGSPVCTTPETSQLVGQPIPKAQIFTTIRQR